MQSEVAIGDAERRVQLDRLLPVDDGLLRTA